MVESFLGVFISVKNVECPIYGLALDLVTVELQVLLALASTGVFVEILYRIYHNRIIDTIITSIDIYLHEMVEKVGKNPKMLDDLLGPLIPALFERMGGKIGKGGSIMKVTGNKFIDGLIMQFAPTVLEKFAGKMLPELAEKAETSGWG